MRRQRQRLLRTAAAVRAAGAPVGDLFVPGDAVHPNELGHAALGAAIAARVLELGLLSEE